MTGAPGVDRPERPPQAAETSLYQRSGCLDPAAARRRRHLGDYRRRPRPDPLDRDRARPKEARPPATARVCRGARRPGSRSLPAGHVRTWGAMNAETALAHEPYPLAAVPAVRPRADLPRNPCQGPADETNTPVGPGDGRRGGVRPGRRHARRVPPASGWREAAGSAGTGRTINW